MIAALLKQTVTLLALVEPFSLIPLFLQATASLAIPAQHRYARVLALTVTVALIVAGVCGGAILDLLGLTLGGMRVGGGIIVLILAIAMVLGQEKMVKQTAAEANAAAERQGYGIVPLGIPLLAGPAALSYMISRGGVQQPADLILLLVPGVVVGGITWTTFRFAARTQRWLTPAMLNVIERLAGFLLAGIAIDMMALGLKQLFPLLGH